MKQLLKNIGFYLAFQLGITLIFMLIFIKSQPFVRFGVPLMIGGVAALIILGPESSKGVSGKQSILIDLIVNKGKLSGRSWGIINEYAADKERAEQSYGTVPTKRKLAKGYEAIDEAFPIVSGLIGIAAGFFIFMLT